MKGIARAQLADKKYFTWIEDKSEADRGEYSNIRHTYTTKFFEIRIVQWVGNQTCWIEIEFYNYRSSQTLYRLSADEERKSFEIKDISRAKELGLKMLEKLADELLEDLRQIKENLK